MNKKALILPTLCLVALFALPGCGKKKETKKNKVEQVKAANKRSKEIIEENVN